MNDYTFHTDPDMPPITRSRDELVQCALAMEEFGGHFASALATAFIRADQNNKQKILNEFGGIILGYKGITG